MLHIGTPDLHLSTNAPALARPAPARPVAQSAPTRPDVLWFLTEPHCSLQTAPQREILIPPVEVFHITSGYNLREILDHIDELRFRLQREKHELSHLYEARIKNRGNAGRNGGEYYSHRPLTRAIRGQEIFTTDFIDDADKYRRQFHIGTVRRPYVGPVVLPVQFSIGLHHQRLVDTEKRR